MSYSCIYSSTYAQSLAYKRSQCYKNTKMHASATQVAGQMINDGSFLYLLERICSLLNLPESNKLIYKIETDYELMVTWGKGWWGGTDWEFRIDKYRVLYLNR